MLGDFHLSAKYPAESASDQEELKARTVSVDETNEAVL
jgi:hypothetical protein